MDLSKIVQPGLSHEVGAGLCGKEGWVYAENTANYGQKTDLR